MKYIDAEKLKSEVKIIQQSLESRDARLNQVKKIRTECMTEFCKCIFDVITSLQQEQPVMELSDPEIADIIQNLFPLDQFIESESLLLDKEEAILFARHFYELGLNAIKG